MLDKTIPSFSLQKLFCGILSVCVFFIMDGCNRKQLLVAINVITLEKNGEVADFTFEESTLRFTLNGKTYEFAMEPLPAQQQPDGAMVYRGIQGGLECTYARSNENDSFSVQVVNKSILPTLYENDPDTFLLVPTEVLAQLQAAGQPLITITETPVP